LALIPGRSARRSLKRFGPEQQFAHHQQRPALAHEVEGMGGAAGILVAAARVVTLVSYFF
jgi:hypothetical protein